MAVGGEGVGVVGIAIVTCACLHVDTTDGGP